MAVPWSLTAAKAKRAIATALTDNARAMRPRPGVRRRKGVASAFSRTGMVVAALSRGAYAGACGSNDAPMGILRVSDAFALNFTVLGPDLGFRPDSWASLHRSC